MGDKLAEKIAHLEMIQGVISRMASDAQTMRTMAITVAAAIIALDEATGDRSTIVIYAAMALTATFWWLTARHLRIEKAYRYLYDEVRKDADVPPFFMEWRPYRWKVPTTAALCATWSVAPPFLAITTILAIFAYRGSGHP